VTDDADGAGPILKLARVERLVANPPGTRLVHDDIFVCPGRWRFVALQAIDHLGLVVLDVAGGAPEVGLHRSRGLPMTPFAVQRLMSGVWEVQRAVFASPGQRHRQGELQGRGRPFPMARLTLAFRSRPMVTTVAPGGIVGWDRT
jgi:hypothetical protein